MIYIRAKIEVENQTEEIELEIRDAILHAIKNNPKVINAKIEVVLPGREIEMIWMNEMGLKNN